MTNKVIKTIIYSGKYYGLKRSESSHNKIIMNQFGANLIKTLSDYNDLQKSGIYFLINEKDNNTEIYIGQATCLYERLKQHNNDPKKEFNKIICFYSLENFSKTYFDYLEYYFIDKINSQDYYICMNGNNRKTPNISEFETIEINSYIDSINEYLDFAEINFNNNTFDNNSNKSDNSLNENNIFYFENASLIYTNGNFYLLKGSKIKNNIKESNNNDDLRIKWYKNRNDKFKSFIENNIEYLQKNEDYYILNNNLKVSSPSFAGCLAKGVVSCNGWFDWKNKDKKTLDEIYRK